jgi:hypothetical protein
LISGVTLPIRRADVAVRQWQDEVRTRHPDTKDARARAQKPQRAPQPVTEFNNVETVTRSVEIAPRVDPV